MTPWIVLLVAVGLVKTEGCNIGWTQFNDKCYMFSHTAVPWGEAESICSGFKSKLAEPMTAGESAFLISHSQNQGGNFWIAVSDIIEEDRWVYSSNQQVTLVTNWGSSQPNQHTSANCVCLWKDFNGKWADEPCRSSYYFICESLNESGQEVIG